MTWFGSTEQSVSWFKDRMREGSLEIKPPYQRKPIWKLEQKCALIESILLDMPIPEIFMQTVTTDDGSTTHAIVDGQQRIRTILHFMGLDPTESESEFQNFSLSKLDPSSPFYNKDLASLSPDARSSFYAYEFTVRRLRTRDDSKIRDVFQRLNRYQSPMLAQELRNASFSGPFLQFVTNLANLPYWSKSSIITPDKIRRMEDVEFISELTFALMLGPQSGNKETINELYSTYDSFEDEFPEQVKYSRLFEDTLDIITSTLPDISSTRWANKSDFYSLFTYIGRKLNQGFTINNTREFSLYLNKLSEDIADYQRNKENSEFHENQNIVKYVTNVLRGASDKSRRSSRNIALSGLLDSYFSK